MSECDDRLVIAFDCDLWITHNVRSLILGMKSKLSYLLSTSIDCGLSSKSEGEVATRTGKHNSLLLRHGRI